MPKRERVRSESPRHQERASLTPFRESAKLRICNAVARVPATSKLSERAEEIALCLYSTPPSFARTQYPEGALL
jgi:hypothetical protein